MKHHFNQPFYHHYHHHCHRHCQHHCHHQSVCFLKVANFVTRTKFNTKIKKIKPSLISTVHAERNFKENAGVKNTSLYNEIKDLDLIAPKLKYDHVSCYRDFNRNIDNIKESV